MCRQDPGLPSALPGPHRDEIDQARNSEAQAAVAAAAGDPATARTRLQWAAGQFQRAGQPLDAERCRRTLGAIARDLAGR